MTTSALSEHRPEGLIKIANTLLEKQMNELISAILPELTGPQFVIVYYLYEHPEWTIRQKDVADRFYLSHPTVRGMVKRLISTGWLTAGNAQGDRRQVVLNLTDKARRSICQQESRILRALDTTTGMALSGFSVHERQTLEALLRRVIDNMSGMSRHGGRA